MKQKDRVSVTSDRVEVSTQGQVQTFSTLEEATRWLDRYYAREEGISLTVRHVEPFNSPRLSLTQALMLARPSLILDAHRLLPGGEGDKKTSS